MDKTKAVILAAGFGSRMGNLTKDCPKPLLPIGNRTLIEYLIISLKKVGVTEIGINLHYHADQIRNHLGDGKKLGVQITYVYEDQPSGTAGGVKKLAPFLADTKNFFVVYGDIFTNQDFAQLIQKSEDHDAAGVVLFHKRQASNSYAELNNSGCVTKFVERPTKEDWKEIGPKEEFLVNSAVYYFKRSVLDLIPESDYSDFPKDIFPKLILKNGLFGVELTGDRVAVDTPEKYENAIQNFNKDPNSYEVSL